MEAETQKCIKRMRSRLERWELSHLRELAADLHTQLEASQARAEAAEAMAELWQQDFEMAMREVREANPDAAIVLTLDGAMHIVQGGVI
jgi:hypothetical protein